MSLSKTGCAILIVSVFCGVSRDALAWPRSPDPAGYPVPAGCSASLVAAIESPRGSSVLWECSSILAVGGLAAWISSIQEDPERMARSLDRPSLEPAIDAGGVFGNGYVIGGGSLGLLVLGESMGRDGLSRAASDLCLSYALSGAAVWILKLSIDRERPDGGRYSFPSGHAAAAFSTVPVIARHYGRAAALPFGVLAVFAGLDRVEDRRHYLSDVLVGAAIGLAAGEAVAGGTTAGTILNHFSAAPGGVTLRYRF